MTPRFRRAAGAVLVVGLVAGCGSSDRREGSDDPSDAEVVGVDGGGALFQANCAVCHGPAADGTPAGPPLVHELYGPSALDDEAFHVAVEEGVPPTHFDFAPMPPVRGLDRDEVAAITAWVRERQAEAGLE